MVRIVYDHWYGHVWDSLWRVRDFARKVVRGLMPYRGRVLCEPPHVWFERLQPLIRALEAGGYDARPCQLVQGSPLKVESLEAVMKCVTFLDPGWFRERARLFRRLARVAGFFRLRGWVATFDQVAIYFESDAKRYSIQLHKGTTACAPSASEPASSP